MTQGTNEQEQGVGGISRHAAAWLAWALWALSLALTAGGLLLLVLNSSHPEVPVYFPWSDDVLLAVGYSTVGAVIVSRMPPENPIGWLFCAIGPLWAVVHFCAEYAIYALLAAPGSLPAGEAASWVYCWIWVPSYGLIVLLGLLFPNGRFLSDRWRWFARLSALLMAVGTVLAAFSPGPIVGLPTIRNPLGMEGLPNVYIPLQWLMLVLIAGAVASLLMRRLYARGIERQQTKWFTYVASVAVSGAIIEYVISNPFGLVWLGWVGHALLLIGLAGMPISMGIAILRYRLYDIDIIINRTLVYGALTVVMAIIFQSIDATLHYLLATLAHVHSLPGSIIAALVVGALFDPVRHRLQRFVDGFLNPGGDGRPGRHSKRSPSS